MTWLYDLMTSTPTCWYHALHSSARNTTGYRYFSGPIRIFIASSLLILWASQAASSPQLQAQLKELQTEQQSLEQELRLTQANRAKSEEELQQQERELQIRRLQLEAMGSRLGDSPDEQALGRLHNEQQRLRLAELGAQSQKSTVERMERREQALADELARLARAIEQTQGDITRRHIALREAEQRRADELAAQLAALKQENEALRLSMQEEQRAAQTVPPEEEPEPLPPEALQDDDVVTVQETGDPTSPGGALGGTQDPTRMVLEDEPPIYDGDDGREVIIRSSGIRRPVTLTETAPDIFQADIEVVGSGRVFFDLRQRRYRGRFPAEAEAKVYRFTYDATDPDHPLLHVRRLARPATQ